MVTVLTFKDVRGCSDNERYPDKKIEVKTEATAHYGLKEAPVEKLHKAHEKKVFDVVNLHKFQPFTPEQEKKATVGNLIGGQMGVHYKVVRVDSLEAHEKLPAKATTK